MNRLAILLPFPIKHLHLTQNKTLENNKQNQSPLQLEPQLQYSLEKEFPIQGMSVQGGSVQVGISGYVCSVSITTTRVG